MIVPAFRDRCRRPATDTAPCGAPSARPPTACGVRAHPHVRGRVGGAQMILSLLEYTARRVGVQPQPEGLNASLLWSAQPGAGL